MAGPFKVVYEDQDSRLVEVWSDEAAIAGGWMPLWLSLVGRDSAVKAVGTAIQRGLRVEAEPGAPEELRTVLEYRYVGTPRVRYTRVAGLTHALVSWEHDGWALAAGETEEEALLRALDGVSTLPWEPDWAGKILRAAKGRGERSALLREVGIWSARGFRKAVISLKKDPEEWDLLIQALVQQGRLEIPGARKRAGRREEVFRSLDAYLRTFGEELGRRIAEEFAPLYDPAREQPDPRVKELKAPLMRAQADVATALARALATERKVILSGEMGVGKTRMGAVIPWLHAGRKPFRALVMCPGQLLEKWSREIRAVIPGAKVEILPDWRAVLRLRDLRGVKPRGPEFYVLARDRAKLGYFLRPAVIPDRFGVARCPSCFEAVKDKNGVELVLEDFGHPTKRNKRCPSCGTPLWQASSKLRRYAPAEIVKRRLRGFFDYLIADEVHELKSDAAQGEAFGMLAGSIPFTIAMTGTLLGGYASDAFRLFWRLDPRGMLEEEKLRWEDLQAWIERYGVLERVVKDSDDARLNRASRGKQSREYVRERPGLSPELFSRRIMERTAFLALDDLRTDLPPYREEVELVPMTEAQAEGYRKLEGSFDARDRKQLGAMLQALLAYPDAPWDARPLAVGDPPKVIRPQALPESQRYPKEEALVRTVTEEKLRGRRAAVYVTFTGKRDLLPRLEGVLREHGLSVAVLRSSVPPERREEWLRTHPADVLLCHPSLVETGLDLYEYPTIIWYSTGYRLSTLRQASRRSWRIGQTQPVLVRFLAYEGTLQEAAIRLMGAKLRAATSMEGKFSVEGLQSMAEGADLAGELARTLLEGMSSIPTVEELWHQASLALEEGPAAEPVMAQPKLIVLTERKGRGRRAAMAGQVALFEV